MKETDFKPIDNEVIKAMEIMKTYCQLCYDCLHCPMYDNCTSSVNNYPGLWYVPEVETLKLYRAVKNGAVIERPYGEWISNSNSQFINTGRHCSICGKTVEFSENFCPECGAYMRGKDND